MKINGATLSNVESAATASYIPGTNFTTDNMVLSASFAVSASWAPSSGGGGGDTTAVEAQTWFLI